MELKQKLAEVVAEMARMAVALGGDADDTTGIVKNLVQSAGLDMGMWYAVCREIETRVTPKPVRRIGFVY